MPFKDRFVNDELGAYAPPGKFYMHTAGLEVWGVDRGQAISGAISAIKEGMRQAGNPRELFHKKYEIVVGALWGDRGKKIIDVFGATEAEIQSGNPEIEGWVIENGVVRPSNKTCLETYELVRAEFRARVDEDSLLRYLRAPAPKLASITGESETHHFRY